MREPGPPQNAEATTTRTTTAATVTVTAAATVTTTATTATALTPPMPPPTTPAVLPAPAAVVVPLYTDYDCEGSLQLPEDAATLFDADTDGAEAEAKGGARRRGPLTGCAVRVASRRRCRRRRRCCSFFGCQGGLLRHRRPHPEGQSRGRRLSGACGGLPCARGPGWLGLTRRLGLEPVRTAVRFELESDGSGLVRASRA